MKILALDTSTETGGVALLEGEMLRAQAQIRVAKTHTNQLWKTIYFLLEQADWGLNDIDLWAIAIGPGSFTGLRIGMATVKGLALATGKPVMGVSSLEALASSFPYCPYLICPLIDARKKEVFCAFFKSSSEGVVKMIGEVRHINPQNLVREFKEPVLLVGNGAELYRDFFKEALGSKALFPQPHLHFISPMILGILARSQFLQGRQTSLDAIRPLYIRPSEAEYNQRRQPVKLTW